MAFATDPLFCTAYPLHFVDTDDPAQMTFRNQQNHPVSFTGDCLMVHQLLVQDCPEHEYAMDTCHGCLLIPRGMQFPPEPFPTDCHSAQPCDTIPCDPKTGEDAPFITCRSFH